MIDYLNMSSLAPDYSMRVELPLDGFSPEEKEATLAIVSSSSYKDLKWNIDKANMDRNPGSKYILNFTLLKDSPEFLDYVKYWILANLTERKSIGHLNNLLIRIRNFKQEICPEIDSPYDLNREHIDRYYDSLFGENRKTSVKDSVKKWNTLKSFLKTIQYKELLYQMNRYIVPATRREEPNFDKKIPEEVASQLDKVMKNEGIPLSFRVVYWMLRLIPNRLNEVMSMTVDCLKKLNDTTYTISLPTFKMSGAFDKGVVRIVQVKYEGIGAYLVDLIKEQIKFTRKHVRDPVFLLYDYKSRFRKPFEYIKYDTVQITKSKAVDQFFYTLPERFDIRDKDGNPAHISSHMFRHNAISDRINSKLFRPIDITALTGHRNIVMIESFYYHANYEETVKVIQENDLSRTPVLFNGRIISGNEDAQYKRILKRKFAYEIPGLGVCSDIRDCSKEKFQCLACPYLLLDVDNLDSYKEQLENWKQKLDYAQRLNSESFMENCRYNIKLFELAIERIVSALTDMDVVLVESKNKEETNEPTG